MSATPLTYLITEPFGNSAAPADILLPIPVPSQLPGSPGRASFDDGFPPANFLPTTASGVPPSGKDFNGIFFMITAYLAYFQAGQRIVYDAGVSTAIGGYPVGAVLQSAVTAGLSFTSAVANNTNDPDTTLTGWIASATQYSSSAPTAGAHNDIVLPGPSNYILDYDTTAGAVTLGGWVAQRGGQRIITCCTGANALNFATAAGTAANRPRINSALTLLNGDSLAWEYNSTVARWIQT